MLIYEILKFDVGILPFIEIQSRSKNQQWTKMPIDKEDDDDINPLAIHKYLPANF